MKIWFQNRRMKWRNSKERELMKSKNQQSKHNENTASNLILKENGSDFVTTKHHQSNGVYKSSDLYLPSLPLNNNKQLEFARSLNGGNSNSVMFYDRKEKLSSSVCLTNGKQQQILSPSASLNLSRSSANSLVTSSSLVSNNNEVNTANGEENERDLEENDERDIDIENTSYTSSECEEGDVSVDLSDNEENGNFLLDERKEQDDVDYEHFLSNKNSQEQTFANRTTS